VHGHVLGNYAKAEQDDLITMLGAIGAGAMTTGAGAGSPTPPARAGAAISVERPAARIVSFFIL